MERHERSAEQDALWRVLVASRAVSIVRLAGAFPLPDIARALYEGGIRVVEFPLTTPGALDAVTACRERCADLVVGVGTVHCGADARRGVDAGAQFIASYGFDEGVVTVAREHHVLALPGAMTPTEIATAWQAGADAVKVFPAHLHGPEYISMLSGPLPHIPLLPSGGIAAANAPLYLRAGAAAVGVADLASPAALESADWAGITARARTLVEAIHGLPCAAGT